MRARFKSELIELLYKDFKEYNIPCDVTMDSYLAISGRGIMRRAIRKSFKTWPRTLSALLSKYPELRENTSNFPEVEDVQPEIEVEEKTGIDPLAALSKASTSD